MQIIYSLESVVNNEQPSIFLAGPTYRISDKCDHNPSWRKEALTFLQFNNFNGIVYIPEFKNDKLDPNFTLSRQVDWELKAMNSATVILFWIPRDLEKLPAFTTNIEFGERLNSGKIVIGGPPTAQKNEYIKERCSRLQINWNYTLDNCIKEALDFIKKTTQQENTPEIWITADTHFNHQRTLELSHRPFNNIDDMNWTLIKNWNSVVKPKDIVIHLGDFGDPQFLKYLNGESIKLLKGNYETPEILEQLKQDKRFSLLNHPKDVFKYKDIDFKLMHEPIYKENEKEFCLFGHIHKLQMIKTNALNIGTDCHNYTPINFKTVMFYRTAILNHYDNNVFCA